MALDPVAEHNAITAFLEAGFVQEVFEDVADGVTQTWVGTKMTPYIAVDYGMPLAMAGGRSIAAEELQPTEQRVIVAACASENRVARQIASKVVRELTGFIPSDNAGPLKLTGGGAFTIQTADKPTVYVSEVYFRYGANYAT